MKKNKIGIMGGTFDPIHIAHLIMAQEALEALSLDRIVFIPAGNPPHKRHHEFMFDKFQRLEMVRLAIEDNESFFLDDEEIKKEGYSYTYETLQRLNKTNPGNDYYFIIGGDSLRDFHTWKEPFEITRNAHIVATYRPNIDEDFDYLIKKNREAFGGDFIKLEMPLLDISSSEIRERIDGKKEFRYFLPRQVYEYIRAIPYNPITPLL